MINYFYRIKIAKSLGVKMPWFMPSSRGLSKLRKINIDSKKIWDEEQEKQHNIIEKKCGIRPLKWRPTESKLWG